MVKKKRSQITRKKSATPRAAVEFMGQLWHECEPATDDELSSVERQLKLTIPAPVKELLTHCAGGVPERSYFLGKAVEVGLGRVLDATAKKARRLNSLEAVLAQARRAGLPDGSVPFAFDNGNSGLLCTQSDSSAVVYFTSDPPGTITRVTDSMKKFLEGLEEPPY